MSETTFNFNEVKTSTSKPVIRPGVNEAIKIGTLTDELTVNGKKVIRVPFSNSEGAELNIDMSMEGNAPTYTLRKLKHMMTKIASEEVVNAATTLGDINKILSGQILRMKFTGEEFVKDGKTYVRTTLGLPDFAEPTSVPANQSKLTYNPDNQYDLKRVNQETLAANTASSDLPF